MLDTPTLSAMSALVGSMVGALSSSATTWMNGNTQYRRDKADRERGRREQLYSDFIDEASRLFADAVQNEMREAAQVVKLFSLLSRIRLFAPLEIVASAEEVINDVISTYRMPNRSMDEIAQVDIKRMDPVRAFSEKCREDLM